MFIEPSALDYRVYEQQKVAYLPMPFVDFFEMYDIAVRSGEVYNIVCAQDKNGREYVISFCLLKLGRDKDIMVRSEDYFNIIERSVREDS